MGCFAPLRREDEATQQRPRCGSRLLSLSADARSSDDVIAFRRPGSEIRRSVTILPRIPESNYAAMFKASDAFVSASHGEGWGRYVLVAAGKLLLSINVRVFG